MRSVPQSKYTLVFSLPDLKFQNIKQKPVDDAVAKNCRCGLCLDKPISCATLSILLSLYHDVKCTKRSSISIIIPSACNLQMTEKTTANGKLTCFHYILSKNFNRKGEVQRADQKMIQVQNPSAQILRRMIKKLHSSHLAPSTVRVIGYELI